MTKKNGRSKTGNFIGRRDIFKKIRQDIKKQTSYILLKGPTGVGKSFILNKIIDDLKKNAFEIIMFRGNTSAEMILKKITQRAAQKGIADAEKTFTSPVEYKEKLKKFLENFLYKDKFLLVFEDFDENQNVEGEIQNDRLKELLFYFKEELKDKDSAMIFCTRQAIPKFDSIDVNPFSWEEFQSLVSKTTRLSKLSEKQLKTFYFDMGGFPRAVELLDKIALQEFADNPFDWPKLRERVPNLAERLLHKDNENADFSYLLIEALINFLDPSRRHILNSLCLHRGWISEETVKAHHIEIKTGDRKKLEKLALVHFIPKKEVYEIHRLTIQIVRSWLNEVESKQGHLCAAQYFESLIPRVSSDKNGEKGTNNEFSYDENAMEARWHYIEAGQIEKALKMTFQMDFYFSSIGFPQLAFDLIQEMEVYVAEVSEPLQIHLHLRLGAFYSVFGRLDDAIKQHEACLKLHESQNDTKGISINYGQLGLLYDAKGKYDEALENYQKALAAAEQLNDTEDIARRLGQVGSIQKRQGKYNDAFESYQRALPINRELKNQAEVGANLEQLARIHDEQGKFDIAIDYYNQSLEIKEELKDKPGIAGLIHQLGNIKFITNQIEDSFNLYQRSLKIKEEIEDHKGAGYSLGQLGLIYQRKGNIDEALQHFEKSLDKFQTVNEEKGIAANHHQIGRIYESKGEMDKALEHYEKALEIREKTGDMLGAAITYGQLGMLYFQKEDYETALKYSTQAYAIFTRFGSPNAELARNNMIRIRQKLPIEKFDEILNQFNIKTGPTTQSTSNESPQSSSNEERSGNPKDS